MIGLGVGIDYALFIVTRYREDLHRACRVRRPPATPSTPPGGRDLRRPHRRHLALGMIAMGLDFIRGIGIGAAIRCSSRWSHRSPCCRRCSVLAGGTARDDAAGGASSPPASPLSSLVGLGLGFPPAGAGVLLAVVGAPGRHRSSGPLTTATPAAPRSRTRETFAYRYSRLDPAPPWTPPSPASRSWSPSRSRSSAPPRVLRRGQLPRGHHHPTGLRPHRRGLRARVQRSAHPRHGGDPTAPTPRHSPTSSPPSVGSRRRGRIQGPRSVRRTAPRLDGS